MNQRQPPRILVAPRSVGRLRRAGVALLTLAALSAPLASPALAVDDKKDFSMRPWVAAQLTEARDEINEKKYGDALETLRSARDRGKLSPHEEAMVTQTEGYVYSAKSDYARAAVQFEKALATEAMPDQAMLELHYNLGQLYQVQRDFKKALVHMLRWVAKVDKPKGRDLHNIATVYYQAGYKDRSLVWVRKAIATSSKPKEEWLNFASMLLFEKKNYKALPPILEPLATLYPKKLYYDQLYAVLVKTNRMHEGLAVLEMEYLQGFLDKPEEFQNLAIMYLSAGVPLKGAEVMEKAMKAGQVPRNFKAQQLLAECLLSAKELERALAPLSSAAKASGDGDLYMRIAEIHVTYRRWGKAREAINQALAKGKLGADTGNAYLLLGIANYRDKRTGPASTAFNQARKHKRVAKQAEQWLTLIQSNSESG